MAKFPRDLADAVVDRWNNLVGGEYVPPKCPPKALLRNILEACYLAAGAPEEARYPKFSAVVTPDDTSGVGAAFISYEFDNRRPVSVEEIRRLAPATDFRKSTIWIVFDDKECYIAGLCDLGTSWHRARLGLAYNYSVPRALLVQADRPGRLKVYQGEYAVGSLSDGILNIPGLEIPLFLHAPAHNGLERLSTKFIEPEVESPRDYESFWFTALCNVFSAIANSISVSGHGGMLVLFTLEADVPASLVRTKYVCRSSALHDAFIAFINARNKTADYWTATEMDQSWEGDAREAELVLISATEQLVEAIRFIAQMAGCDGAILLTSDLHLLGFGAEIRAEMDSGASVFEVVREFSAEHRSCDIEQFGMRHRSAIKLVSKLPGACILAVSQDGPIRAVWSKDGSVMVRKGAPLGNMNIPWA